jgi:hypothetical protein
MSVSQEKSKVGNIDRTARVSLTVTETGQDKLAALLSMSLLPTTISAD